MLDSVALNVVISLVFIYLLYSLLVTTINEGLANVFKLRSKTLEKGIIRMLTDDQKNTNELVKEFFEQPLIKFLGEGTNKKPAYLKASSFSKVLLDICRERSTKKGDTASQILEGIQKIKAESPQTGKYLESLMKDARHNVADFQAMTEHWFDETMDRATGWYKKQAQRITMAVAFAVVILFNVDSIAIAKLLASNPKLAYQMVETAEDFSDKKKALVNTSQKDTTSTAVIDAEKIRKIKSYTDRTDAVMGLGWDREEKVSGSPVCHYFKKLLGWLLTTLAISIGAPFWFDLLNKFMLLRGSKKTE